MKYAKKDAKAYARAHMKGIWAAALTPSPIRSPSTRTASGRISATGSAN